ncbi:DUF4124 domain-containing protein [Xanthomonas hortorum]|uniref:DUF4124 domain-containing protein n=1 Tax=Xanthomonas hortorum TaxID=56454 RepID=UPI001F1A9F0F|nr:DUF4124 domain-containing protein [Xanthomonas hortorum]MCE4517780.1 DUF4124 domain-containing protein [Xanthomonas hortorum pv. vitians]
MKRYKARIVPFILCSFYVLVMFIPRYEAYAQQVYKCRERGQVVYQSSPCSSGSAERVWQAPPDPVNPALQRRLAATAAQLRARNARLAQSASGAYVETSSSNERYGCEAAKAQRHAVYEAAGVHRSFALSSYWDNVVQDACK